MAKQRNSAFKLATRLLANGDLQRALAVASKDTQDLRCHWLRGQICRRLGRSTRSPSDAVDFFCNTLREYQHVASANPQDFLRFVARDGQSSLLPQAAWAVPAYVELLSTLETSDKLLGVAYALGSIGAEAKDAVPTLQTALQRPDLSHVVAGCIKSALYRITASPEKAAAAERRKELRSEVAERLEEHEFDGYGKLQNAYIHGTAWRKELGLPAEELIARCGDRDVAVAARAACIVGVRRIATSGARDALYPLLLSQKAVLRCMAVYALGRMAVARQDAEHGVLQMLQHMADNDRSLYVRKTAIESMGLLKQEDLLGEQSERVLAWLTSVMGIEDPKLKHERVQATICWALAQFGLAARNALPSIEELARHMEEPANKRIAVESILRIGIVSPRIIDKHLPALIAFSRDADDALRSQSVDALVDIQAKDERRIIGLAERAILDHSRAIRQKATIALHQCDPEQTVYDELL